jgi:hypothetical protein
LAKISIGRLILRDIPDTALDLGVVDVAKEIVVEGGNVQWASIPLGCPDGGDDCEWKERKLRKGLTVHITKTPLCDPDLVKSLSEYGAVFAESRCADFPTALERTRKSMEEEWTALVGEDVSSHVVQGADSLENDSLQTDPGDTTQILVESISEWNSCGAQDYPRGFDLSHVYYGKNWVDYGGNFYTGDAINLKYKGHELQAGMTREQVIQVTGKPAINEGGFLAWGIYGECEDPSSIAIRAHFDSNGQLDGLFIQHSSECADC